MTDAVPAEPKTNLGDRSCHVDLRWRPADCVAFLLVITLLVIGPAIPLAAQPSAGALSGYTSRIWTTREGLPQNLIRTLLQTRDGYIWIGTANAGLVRFDGVTFTVFDVANTPQIPSNWISALFEDRDGALWVGTADGVVRYHRGSFTAHRLGNDTRQSYVTAIQADKQGRLWIATSTQVVRREGDAWVPIPLGNPSIGRLLLDRDGTAWIATSAGLVEWREGVKHTWSAAVDTDGVSSPAIRAFYQDRGGQLWLGTARGLARIDRKSGTVHRDPHPDLQRPIHHLFEDRSGVLWIGSGGQLLSRGADGAVSAHAIATSGAAQVSDIIDDREGHVWVAVGSGPGGLYRLRHQSVSMIAHEQGLPCDNIAATTEAADGTIWIGTVCEETGGLVAIRNGRVQPYDGPGSVSSLLAEPDGTLWVSTFGGELFRFAAGRFERQVVSGGPTGTIVAIHRDEAGALWLGATRGLFRYHDGRWTAFQMDDGLPSDDVRSIVAGRGGSLWIGTYEGLTHYAGGRFKNYTNAQGLPRAPVRAIHVDADGAIWIGTYGGGLCRLKDERLTVFGTQGGLLDSSVHRILEDPDANLWLSGDRGIRRVSRRELNDVAEGRQSRVTALLFDDTDGMKSAECNGMGQPAGSRMRDGMLWFPTQGGVVRINPQQAGGRVPIVPAAAIEQTAINRVPYPLAPALTAPPDSTEVEIRYTAPVFQRPEHTQFRYRLDGYDSAWVEAGNRRVAHYANLAPGRYTFRVTARSAGGPWSDEAATIAFVLQPYFYQRVPVQIAAVLLIIGSGVVAGRIRMTRLRQRAAHLETAVAERTTDLARQRDETRGAHDHLAAAQHTLEQAHGQVLAVLNQLELAALVLAEDGTVRYASQAAERLLVDAATARTMSGSTALATEGAASIIGRSWTECLPLSEAERAQVRARFEAPPPSRTRLPVQVSINGRRYWMEIDVRDEPPPGVGRILYLSDVTEMFGLRARSEGRDAFHGMAGRSTSMQLVFKQIRDVAGADVTVLIEGETGSGKELVARAIHRSSRRAEQPFVAVNTAGLTESLLASQLFGHRRGAFTGAVADQLGLFESANGGTLFLDEIGDIPLSVQTSLLRVLQEREITRLGDTSARKIDVRFVAATHRDLAREVTEGRMRQDLLYRIRVATIQVPPLRERPDDLPLLVETFLAEVLASSTASGKDIRGVARDAMDAVMAYSWPGNVRELKSSIEQAVLRSSGPLLRLDDFPTDVVSGDPGPLLAPSSADERDRLVDALRRAGGNRAEAARLLGIGRATLYRKLATYGLSDR
jgi:DNA-binding NtrC family response regulator/ligand-binding sensor domain-containing protein